MPEHYSLSSQTFSLLINEQRIYVDKTDLIYELVHEKSGRTYFLSRPRRFGKSLLITTLKSIFEGEQELFKGLFIHDKITWKRFPIIHLSMADIGFVNLGLEYALQHRLENKAKEEGIMLTETVYNLQFRELIIALHKKYGEQVVILIDEYDKPITHGLEAANSDLAIENRDIMKNFYSVLKDLDVHIRFLFITGISKFTKVSIFSELNHLTDLTLDNRFATLCGYTQAEIEHYFPEGIQKLIEKEGKSREVVLSKIKNWYDGFSWNGADFVYNPFSFMQLVASSQFSNYWFETGTPTFLVKMINQHIDYKLKDQIIEKGIYNTFDLRNLNYKTILLQTGYWTIQQVLEEDYYQVGFANKEVEQSFNQMLLGDYLHQHPGDSSAAIFQIRRAFVAADLPQVMKIMESLFAGIPSQLFSRMQPNGKKVGNGENFYHAIIYLIFNLLGVKMQAEVAVKEGRIDAVVETAKNVYIFEFKKKQNPDIAIQQIKERKYVQKYSVSNKTINLVGVSFSLRKRGIDKWKCEIFDN